MSEVFERDSRFSLIATSSTAEGFLRMTMRVPVQIGIIDWDLPTLGGAKLIEALRDQPTSPRIVVYGDISKDLPTIAMSAGAAAFAAHSGEIADLLNTCVEVAEGKMVFPFLDVRNLEKNPIQKLSKKERSMLQELSKEDFKDMPLRGKQIVLTGKLENYSRDELKQYENDPYESRSFLYLDILSWLESKIKNVPIASIIRQKASNINRKERSSISPYS